MIKNRLCTLYDPQIWPKTVQTRIRKCQKLFKVNLKKKNNDLKKTEGKAKFDFLGNIGSH